MRQWLDFQERWLRDGNTCWFASGDDAGIGALEQHLHKRRIPFRLRRKDPEAAVVFEPLSTSERRVA